MIISKAKMQINAKIEEVWEVVTNNKEYFWRKDLSKIEILDEKHFVEYTKNNFLTKFEIIKKEQFKNYECILENDNIKGIFRLYLEKMEDNKVMIELVEEIEIKNNIVIQLFAKPYLKNHQKKYLQHLNKKLSGENKKRK